MTTASSTEELRYDPYDPELRLDPYLVFRRLRDEAPLYHNDEYNFFALTRHADVEAALLDWETFSSARGDILEIVQANLDFPPGIVLWEDPPRHTVHRKLMSRVFTPKRMQALEPAVRALCAECLDPMEGVDRFDIVPTLAAPVPMRVIGKLLGIPEQDQDAVRERSDAALRTKPGEPIKNFDLARSAEEQFAEYIDWRAEHPSDDLMTDLLTAEFEDETGTVRRLTRDEILLYTNVVAGAGNETTRNLITWIAKVFSEHPDQRRLLLDDPALLPNAVEEVLRYESTGPQTARYVARDVELHGQTVPAGSAMILVVAAANRDDARFPDGDRFDITRDPSGHLAFAFGIHYCLGAHLARLEARVVLDELLRRFPDWHVDLDDAQLEHTSTVRGWARLPIVVA